MGASGAGTTTLGAALGERYAATHLDTDDYFWMPTDPPFEETRPMPERLELLTADLDGASSWALSGSICGWGDPLIQRFELVVFLQVPTELRLARLRDRETMEFGAEALAPGGRMHRNHVEFMEWAAGYDDGDLEMRSLARHTAWLEGLRCPVLRLDGEMTIAKQLDAAESMLAGGRP
jgi:adenylate kinase family enzyme